MRLRSLDVRLALIFVILTILFTGAIFAVSYVLLSSTFVQQEERELQARLLEFWALAQTTDEAAWRGSRADLLLQRYRVGREDYLVRLAPAGGEPVLMAPESWREVSPEALDHIPGSGSTLLRFGRRYLAVSSVTLPGGAHVVVGKDVSARIDTQRRFRVIFFLSAAPLAVLSFLGGMLFSVRSLAPIGDLTRTMRAIVETGEMHHRLSPRGSGDELDEMIVIFNRMLERIEALVSGMREALDNAAHDLRTPITRLINQAESALADSGSAGPAMEGVIRQAGVVLDILESLLDIAAAERGALPLDRKPVDVASVVADIAELYSYGAEDKGVSLSAQIPAGGMAPVDVARLRQVLANLLDNAIKYTPSGGSVTLSMGTEVEELWIEVTDTGVGIAEKDVARIWDRLYRGDRSRSEPGLGLGLSLVKAYVEAHGGHVGVRSRPGAGSTFRVAFPVKMTEL